MVKNSFAVWVCCYLLLDSVSCHIMCHETESSSKQQQTAMYVISVEHYNVYSRESKGGGDKTQGVPSTSKSRGTYPLVHPRIYAHGWEALCHWEAWSPGSP